MTGKKQAIRYSPEVRSRAVRMVREHSGEYGSEWKAICPIAAKIGCTGETVNAGVKLRHGPE